MSNTPIAAPHAWDAQALYAKALRYIEEMQGHDSGDWQFAFWSSLALELVARASLSSVSPALLADASEWSHLYFALGNNPNQIKYVPRSIAISEVLNRLMAINPKFDKELRDFCNVHTSMRNAELHSADAPFEVLKAADWLGDFYRACGVLLEPLGHNLVSMLGLDAAAFAEQQIAAKKDGAAKSVLSSVKSFKTVWDAKAPEEKTQASGKAAAWATKQEGHIVDCPACANDALLDGEPIDAPKKGIEDKMVVETQAMSPSSFQCVACGLKISGFSQLNAAGLGSTFKKTSVFEPSEYFYGDDEGRYDEDNNEPY